MDAFDMLRQVLENEALQAANALGFKVIFDEDEAPKNTAYVHFWYETGVTVPKLSGGRRGFECTPGLIQFTIYSPEKQAASVATKLADAIKRRLNRMQFRVPPDGDVKLAPLSVQKNPVVRNGYRITWVRAGFDFDHRDSTASESFTPA